MSSEFPRMGLKSGEDTCQAACSSDSGGVCRRALGKEALNFLSFRGKKRGENPSLILNRQGPPIFKTRENHCGRFKHSLVWEGLRTARTMVCGLECW